MSDEREEQPTAATPTANILPHRPKSSTLPWHGAVTNYSKGEIRAYARRLLSSDEYRKGLEAALLARTLPAAVEVLLYHYAYGRPEQQVKVEVVEDLSMKSTGELQAMLRDAQHALDEAKAIEEAIEVEAQVVNAPSSTP